MDSVTASPATEAPRRRWWRPRWPSGMRLRMAVSVTAVLVLLLVAQGLALVVLYEDLEDEFIESTLNAQMNHSMALTRQLGRLTGPQTPQMDLFLVRPGEPLPPGLDARMAALPVGNHEVFDAGREYHVAVRQIDADRLVLRYDESEHLRRLATVATALLLGTTLLIALVFVLVHAIAARLTGGLEDLARRVADAGDTRALADMPLDGELRAVAQALDTARSRQAAALERERLFNANLSHELRTPLAGIRSDAEMLSAEPALPERARRRAARIVSGTDRITELASSLLLLAREARPATREPVALRACVESVWARLADSVAQAPPPLQVEIAEAAWIETDPTLLALLVRNLLENAWRHGGAGPVRVGWDGVTLIVEDDGPGFGPGDPLRWFEPFAQGGRGAGHGLGLALVRHIAASCGWRVRAWNRQPAGAAVAIDLVTPALR